MIITKKQYNEEIEKAVYKAIAEERARCIAPTAEPFAVSGRILTR